MNLHLFWGIFFGSFVSEDLACISAAAFGRSGELEIQYGVFSAFCGIYVGDLLLFFLGYFFSNSIRKISYVQKQLQKVKLEILASKLERNFFGVIFLSRFTPGLRLPVYFFSGVLQTNPILFAAYTFLACLVWVPGFCLALFWGILEIPFVQRLELSSFQIILSLLVFLFCLRNFGKWIYRMCNPVQRKLFWIGIRKLFHLEFYPAWIFYIPLVFYILFLVLKFRGLRFLFLVNGKIDLGGFLGESKFAILELIPKEFVLNYFLVLPNDSFEKRYFQFQEQFQKNHFNYPVIFKPDIGERGFMVQKIASKEEAKIYLVSHPFSVLVQEFHPGPFEIGIFYIRHPQQARGKIFSITVKKFPKVVGDGKSTLEELVLQNERFRFQYGVYQKRFSDQFFRVIPKGELFPLGYLGNHCQGSEFTDGADWITPELENKIDFLSQQISEFYFGRFDIRFSNHEELLKGVNFKIVELNGITSESTNLYDPKFSFWKSYKILFSQWKELFSIGSELSKNKKLPEFSLLAKRIREHFAYKKQVFRNLEAND